MLMRDDGRKGPRKSSDLSHHTETVVRRVHAARRLVPIEGSHDRALDIAPGQGAVQATCKNG